MKIAVDKVVTVYLEMTATELTHLRNICFDFIEEKNNNVSLVGAAEEFLNLTRSVALN